jgi:hypothetical protein
MWSLLKTRKLGRTYSLSSLVVFHFYTASEVVSASWRGSAFSI